MTEGQTAARTEILGRLRRFLPGGGAAAGTEGGPEGVGKPLPVTDTGGNYETLAECFGAKLEEVHGSFEIVEHMDRVAERIALKVEQWHGSRRRHPEVSEGSERPLLSWRADELPVAGLADELRRRGVSLTVVDDLNDPASRTRAATLAIGLTGVEAAFASTGSVVLVAAPGRSRAAALLPEHHLMIVPGSRIFPTVEAWLEALSREDRLERLVRGTAQIAFITGPSKSADIELSLTLGVHGPRAVHAIVFDDLG